MSLSFVQQENYMGADMAFTDCEEDCEKAKSTGAKSTGAKSTGAKSTGAKSAGANSSRSRSSVLTPFDPRLHRPLDAKVEVELHEIQAHLIKVLN